MKPRVIFLGALTVLLSACAVDMGQGGRFGAYGGPPQQQSQAAEPPFSIDDISFGVRWFPTHVRYAPDSSHFLVSLCHTLRPELCRIGKYFVATNEWEILPFEDKRTYRWPVYSPDGKEIAVSTGACDEQYRCDLYQHVLARMRPDGSRIETVTDITAKEMSFSPDGRKLIYLRQGGIGPNGRRPEFSNIYEMDWATGTERVLTEVILGTAKDGRAHFVDDREAFVYFASGGNGQLAMRYVRVKDAPVTPYSRSSVARLWPEGDPEWRGHPYRVYDVGPNNRLLYVGDLAMRRAGGDGSVMVKDPTHKDSLYFLLRGRSEAMDAAVYKLPYLGPYAAALSPDLKRVAFLDGNPQSYHPTHKGLAIVEQGDVQPIYVAWPKLELKPVRYSITSH